MSKILEFVRGRVPQTIVMTHHPHVIFSDHVDRVFYVEMDAASAAAVPAQHRERHEKPYFQPSPPRKVLTLDGSFDKLSAVYRLFDFRDRQLLKHAAQVTGHCSEAFYGAVLKCFDIDIFESRAGGLPDRQTLLLSQLIASGRKDRACLLDWGAGRGRTIGEMSKIGRWRFPKHIQWHCWEHFEEVREKLRSAEPVKASGAVVLSRLDEVPANAMDYCLLANVLHELTPPQTAQALADCAAKLNRDGRILICEIHPLLHAEKFAVPYREADLAALLDRCGFGSTSLHFTVHDCSAYVLAARWRGDGDPLIEPSVAEQQVWDIWADTERRCLNSYFATDKPASYEQYKNFLQDLTAVASIAAARQQIWR